MGALPNLVIIGAMKCGTTSLHAYLARHPNIGMSDPKEIDFFSGIRSNRGLDWYCSLFDETKLVRGEASQNYSKGHHPFHGGAAKRMAELVPHCKLIYLVRDPIARYASHIAENYIGETKKEIEWNHANDHYVRTGLYYYQLQFFLEYFPLTQIMVVDLTDLQNNRLATMNGIFDFLGVHRIDDPGMFDFVANANGEDVVTVSMRTRLAHRIANKLSPSLTGKFLRTTLIRDKLLPESMPKALNAAERDALAARFRPDVDKLRKLVGKEFLSWSV